MFKLNLQLFADDTTSQLGSAVVGHRMYMGVDVVPSDLDDVVLGVRSTPDLGDAQNTVEANVINSIREENVSGLFPASEIEYTLLMHPTTIENQLKYVNKEIWVYEERENMTSTPEKLGWGIAYKIKVSGITATGQEPEGLQELTQSATLVSDEFYYVRPDYSGDTATYKVVGMQTGKTTSINALLGTSSGSLVD
jgi:hypothetical protein